MATLTFTRSNWSAAQTVTVTGQSDNFSDGDQNYTIILSQDKQTTDLKFRYVDPPDVTLKNLDLTDKGSFYVSAVSNDCLLYTSPSPRDATLSRMPSSA